MEGCNPLFFVGFLQDGDPLLAPEFMMFLVAHISFSLMSAGVTSTESLFRDDEKSHKWGLGRFI